jgi:hypothetical protein
VCTTLCVQTLQTLAPTIRKQRAEQYPDKTHNFFTLVRFDFMLDENHKNWLVEVRTVVQRQSRCLTVGGGGRYGWGHAANTIA